MNHAMASRTKHSQINQSGYPRSLSLSKRPLVMHLAHPSADRAIDSLELKATALAKQATVFRNEVRLLSFNNPAVTLTTNMSHKAQVAFPNAKINVWDHSRAV